MKYSIVIPVYLSRKDNVWEEGDLIYDHPTAINQSGTLVKTLESLEIIKDEKFDVILVVSTTTKELDNKIESWIRSRIKEAKYRPQNLYIFTITDLKKISKTLDTKDSTQNYLMSLGGYSQVRNCGFIAGILNKSDAVIFLDDDELVRDSKFIKKINQGLSKVVKKKKVRFITGLCPEGETGSYVRVRKYLPWMLYWDKIKYQNEAFVEMAEKGSRFKISPLTHGGLCIIHKDLFLKIPFDPRVPRGEDMDYNLNCRMFGYNCYMDNKLEIRHCPPPRTHPSWRSFREDMIRFFIQRNKIYNQNKKLGITKIVKAEDFDPYPGAFLKKNLEEMVFKSQMTLAMEYFSQGKNVYARNTLKNMNIASEFSALKIDFFQHYLNIVKAWKKLTTELQECNFNLRRI
jgi:hypothetical protein